MADAITVPNGMAQIAQLSQILKGFTGTKQTSTGTAAPQAMDALMQIIAQYSPGAARADAEGISTAMLQEAAIKFAPILGQERAAGARGTSGVRQLGEQAQVAAAGEAARTLLQAMTQYGNISGTAAGNAAGATRGQTTTTKSTIDPAQIATQVGAIMAMQALKKKQAATLKGKKEGGIASAVTNKGISALLAGPGAAAAGFDGGVDIFSRAVPAATGAFDPSTLSVSDLLSGKVNLQDFSTALGSVGGDIPYNFLTAPADGADILSGGGGDLLTAAGSGSSFLADSAVNWTTSAGIDAATQAAGSAVAEGFVGDAFMDGGVDLLGSAAGDAAFSMGVPYLTIARLGADALGIKEVGQVLDGVSGAVSDVVSGIGDAVSGVFDSIICTWLYKNGLMPRRLYVASVQHFREYAKKGLPVEGYYVWSRPMLKLMKKSKAAVAVMRYVMLRRAMYIGWRREMPGVKFSAIGAVFAAGLFTLSYTLGKLQQVRSPLQAA